ncbi:hypothetical protein AAEX63_12830 [Luteococcus sp. H138]|uniref:hypothetical protein n=1 Tax=unclassified Luteococcus TaxID=2639923 RepID=UPI00313F1BBE
MSTNRTFDAIEEFKAARGQEADATWAARALWKLTTANLEAGEVDRALARACEQVRESQESAEDLFGSADGWATDQVTELSEQGATFVDDSTDANTFAVVSLGMAGIIALLFAVMLWFKYDDGAPFNGWLAATPVLLGLASVGVATVSEFLQRAHSAVVAWAGAAMVLAVSVGLTFLCFVRGQGAPHRSPVLWLAEALVLFTLAWAASKLVPETPPRFVRAQGPSAVSDDEWLATAAGELRERVDLAEAQVQDALAEARAHAAQSGTRLAQEFGNPVGYARQLPGDQAVWHIRKAMLNSFLLLCWVFVVWDWNWTSSLWGSTWRAAVLLLFFWQAVQNWVGWHRVRARR